MTSKDVLSTWQPPPNFVSVPSNLEGVQVYAPASKAPEPERRTFKCSNCGGAIAYSAAQAGVACPYCGFVASPATAVVGRQAQEAEFTVETMERDQAARGWGQVRRELYCESCGADISLEPTKMATNCPFCASPRVIARQETHNDMLRPSHLIPFKIEREACARSMREWLAQGWMHPPELRRVVRTTRLSGVYLPFWTFSARLDTVWQAEVGHKRKRKTWDGKRKTEIKWEKKSAKFSLPLDDLLVPGSNKVQQKLLTRLYPFDLADLSVYAPEYLAGWQAQAYNIKLRPAWDTARAWMRESARRTALHKINSKYVRNFGMTADMEDERWRYVLLPVYLAAYRYKNETFQVMINGQSGQIAGQKPVAWLRVLGVVGLLLLPGVLLSLLSLLLSSVSQGSQDASGCGLMIGLCIFVVGSLISLRILQRALQVVRQGFAKHPFGTPQVVKTVL